MNQEAYLDEEFRLLGVKPHIVHHRFPAGLYYTVVTVATRYRETFPVSERRLHLDHVSKRIRRVIAKGRLLRLLRQERMK